MTMKQCYPPEFRAEAVNLVLEQGLNQREASSRLGIPKGTLANWVVAAKSGGDRPSPGARTVSELEAENTRLRIYPSYRSREQYCAKGYRALQERFDMVTSMSRRGNCFENAPSESFWGSLKGEVIHHHRFATRAQAESAVRECIEIFYNRQRRHSRLGYLAPAEFEQKYHEVAKAA